MNEHRFFSHNRAYKIDKYGVIHQVDNVPFTYDEKYISTYNTPEYQRESELLQALRLGFLLGAHGTIPLSIMDYGSGNGAFIRFAKKNIFQVCGFDIFRYKMCDIVVHNELHRADVYTFHDSLEHIKDLSFLEKLQADTICISLPYCHYRTNGQDWFDTEYKHRKPDEHLHHFDRDSLSALMRSYGWKEVAFSTHEDIVRKPSYSQYGMINILSMAFKHIDGPGIHI